ncbi:MAG TPA: ComF family protein [Chitinophagales bacterium]|nr:ComF family protein [Chitinophagales bacterium]
MLTSVAKYTSDFFNLFYPKVCLVCSRGLLTGENIVCFRCESELPYTNNWNHLDNPLMKRFWGRLDLKGAAVLYHFHKGEGVQHLIHLLKYKGRKDVGEYIGKRFGYKLMEPDSVIKNVDVIVPVPLHWKKLKQRGYNQCDYLAKGLAEVMNVDWKADALVRVKDNVSQTKMHKLDRWTNVAGIFEVADEQLLKGKHVLLVDDVITTSATTEECLQTILKVPGTTVSFATIGVAER